jgi:hypothetical protein
LHRQEHHWCHLMKLHCALCTYRHATGEQLRYWLDWMFTRSHAFINAYLGVCWCSSWQRPLASQQRRSRRWCHSVGSTTSSCRFSHVQSTSERAGNLILTHYRVLYALHERRDVGRAASYFPVTRTRSVGPSMIQLAAEEKNRLVIISLCPHTIHTLVPDYEIGGHGPQSTTIESASAPSYQAR